MATRIALTIVISCIVAMNHCLAASAVPLLASRVPADAEKDVIVRQVMRSGGIPGIQVVVVNKDRVVWQRSYGYAVLAQPGPITPMKNDSILYTCSVSKIVTAIAVMQQVDDAFFKHRR